MVMISGVGISSKGGKADGNSRRDTYACGGCVKVCCVRCSISVDDSICIKIVWEKSDQEGFL